MVEIAAGEKSLEINVVSKGAFKRPEDEPEKNFQNQPVSIGYCLIYGVFLLDRLLFTKAVPFMEDQREKFAHIYAVN